MGVLGLESRHARVENEFQDYFGRHDTRKQVMKMNVRKNRGLTLIGFLIVLVIVLFFAYAGMRVVPMYLEYHALVNAMNKLQDDPMAKKMPPNRISTPQVSPTEPVVRPYIRLASEANTCS